MLQNLNKIVKSPPDFIIYVFKEFQDRYYEMSNVNIFIKDDVNLEANIKKYAEGRKPLIIFDDLISSSSLPFIADLFTVKGRHKNMSLAFLTQRMFVNDEFFKQISNNTDYMIVFKNPKPGKFRTLGHSVS